MARTTVDESQEFEATFDAIATMLALVPDDMLGLGAEISKNPELAAEVAHELTVDAGRPVSVARIMHILGEISGVSVLDLIALEYVMRKGETLFNAPVQPWPAVDALRCSLGSSLRALHHYVRQLPLPLESRMLH